MRAPRLIDVLNGPNLNLLGTREPEIYGQQTLADVEAACRAVAEAGGFAVRLLQSNAEHQLIDWIHRARDEACAIVINPAALTHSSIAIRDALAAFDGPVIEVHISNIHRREAFRHHSYVSGVADAVLAGFGIDGYGIAVRRAMTLCASGVP